MLIVSPEIRIPLREFQFTFARSGGPGGQNVNKVSSKAVLRWAVLESPSLPEPVRQRLARLLGRRLTAAGELLVTSQRFRDAGRNAADCLEKLRAMVAEAAKPVRRRRPTRPTAGSVQRRLTAKRSRRGDEASPRSRRRGGRIGVFPVLSRAPLFSSLPRSYNDAMAEQDDSDRYDIDFVFRQWPYQAGVISARLVLRPRRPRSPANADRDGVVADGGFRPAGRRKTRGEGNLPRTGSGRRPHAARSSSFPTTSGWRSTANSCSSITAGYAAWRCGSSSGRRPTPTTPWR